jgi:hypothetical protein
MSGRSNSNGTRPRLTNARGVWEYFSGKAEQRGVELSELVTEVLRRDIEINEALK